MPHAYAGTTIQASTCSASQDACFPLCRFRLPPLHSMRALSGGVPCATALASFSCTKLHEYTRTYDVLVLTTVNCFSAERTAPRPSMLRGCCGVGPQRQSCRRRQSRCWLLPTPLTVCIVSRPRLLLCPLAQPARRSTATMTRTQSQVLSHGSFCRPPCITASSAVTQLNKSSGLNGEHLVVSTPGMLLSVEGAHLYGICHKDGRSLSPTYAATHHAGQTEGRLQHRTSLPPGQDNPAQPQGQRATPPATPPGSQTPLGGRQPPPGAAQLRGASGAQTLCSKVVPFCSICDCSSGLRALM